jgi:protein-S-isoprenylcysteine O-methyltransferase Ste14
VYRRFAFQHAAVAAMVCAALVPPQLDIARPMQRLLAAAILAAAFVLARNALARHGDERRDERANLQAAALVGVYVSLNLYANWGVLGWFPHEPAETWFKWSSYALTWAIPVFGVWLGVRDRERRLIDAGLATALASLLTNKLYLGWPRQTWDPILLGAVLIAVAVALRRWLASGPGGERRGFTGVQILESDRQAIRLAALASAVHAPGAREPAPAATEFGGGRSGGAGAGAEF